jgi:ribose transport system substrate-binding protein
MTIDLCKGKNPCNVVYMPGLLSFPPSKGRHDVYMKLVGAVKSIKIVADQEAQFAADPAVKAMQNILQAQSDIDVVATDGDQMTFGAEQAIKSAGRSGIALTGNGGGKLGLTAIRAGRWYGTVYSKPFTMGSKAAEYAIMASRGQKVPKQLNLFVGQKATDTGPVVTKRNVSKVKAQWTG